MTPHTPLLNHLLSLPPTPLLLKLPALPACGPNQPTPRMLSYNPPTRSYGVLGTATKLLSVGSNITSAITGTSTSALGGASSSTSSGERVGNVGQGLVKGTLTFGGGLLKGVTGIVADPVAGAKQGGVLGFMTGVGKGLVGVPGQIIGGALSAASQVTEGLDASVSKVRGLVGEGRSRR